MGLLAAEVPISAGVRRLLSGCLTRVPRLSRWCLTRQRRSAEANGQACGAGANGSKGYAYAGHQATTVAHGVRATITPTAAPNVTVGARRRMGRRRRTGPGCERRHALAAGRGRRRCPTRRRWSTPRSPAAARRRSSCRCVEGRARRREPPGRGARDVGAGRTGGACGSTARRDDPILLPHSSDRWRPIATAESWNGGQAVCNSFAFRFDGVGVAPVDRRLVATVRPRVQVPGPGVRRQAPEHSAGSATRDGRRRTEPVRVRSLEPPVEARRGVPRPRLHRRARRTSQLARTRIGVPSGIRSRRKFAVSFEIRTHP